MKIFRRIRFLLTGLFTLTVLMLQTGCGEHAPSTPTLPPDDSTNIPITGDTLYLAPRTSGVFDDVRLTEISGIAASRERSDVLWVHNDSGDKSRLFAVDTAARTIAEVLVSDASNIDWEDMASASIGGKSWLYIADAGDNGSSRQQITIYRCAEPFVDAAWRDTTISVAAERMVLQYPDGPHDCEALFVDARDETLYLISKTGDEACGVYRIQWKAGTVPVVLGYVAELRIPAAFSPLRLVTAADLAADGSAIIVRTYTALYEYRGSGTPAELLARVPRTVKDAPVQPQGEAVCFARSSRGVFVATEGSRQPLHFLVRRSGR